MIQGRSVLREGELLRGATGGEGDVLREVVRLGGLVQVHVVRQVATEAGVRDGHRVVVITQEQATLTAILVAVGDDDGVGQHQHGRVVDGDRALATTAGIVLVDVVRDDAAGQGDVGVVGEHRAAVVRGADGVVHDVDVAALDRAASAGSDASSARVRVVFLVRVLRGVPEEDQVRERHAAGVDLETGRGRAGDDGRDPGGGVLPSDGQQPVFLGAIDVQVDPFAEVVPAADGDHAAVAGEVDRRLDGGEVVALAAGRVLRQEAADLRVVVVAVSAPSEAVAVFIGRVLGIGEHGVGVADDGADAIGVGRTAGGTQGVVTAGVLAAVGVVVARLVRGVAVGQILAAGTGGESQKKQVESHVHPVRG